MRGVARNKDKVSQVYETSVNTKRVQTNWKTLHMLLETNDALRVERIYILVIIFMVLSETNGALMVNISQLHFQFTVCESGLLIRQVPVDQLP